MSCRFECYYFKMYANFLLILFVIFIHFIHWIHIFSGSDREHNFTGLKFAIKKAFYCLFTFGKEGSSSKKVACKVNHVAFIAGVSQIGSSQKKSLVWENRHVFFPHVLLITLFHRRNVWIRNTLNTFRTELYLLTPLACEINSNMNASVGVTVIVFEGFDRTECVFT